MSPLRRWSALAVLALPVLLISVDMTVLGFAVPALSADLGPTSTELLWIVDIYSFVLAVCFGTVPLALVVSQLSSMTTYAERSTSAIELMLESATGTLFIAVDETGRTGSALAYITIVPRDAENTPPRPENLTARAVAGTPVRIPVQTTGIDPEGDSVMLTGVTSPMPTLGEIVSAPLLPSRSV